MTTPAFREPYAEIFSRTSSSSNFDSPVYRTIPTGVSTLMLTWAGTRELNVLIRRNSGEVTQIGRIEPGTGRRSLVIPGVSAKSGDIVQVLVTTNYGQDIGVDATMTVVTTPLRGAGGG